MNYRHLLFGMLLFCVANAYAGSGQIDVVKEPAQDVYIVRLDESITSRPSEIAPVLAKLGAGAVTAVFDTTMMGFAFRGSESAARAISRDSRVASVQQASKIHATGSQQAPSWGLDRVDQLTATLDGIYRYDYTGTGAVIYVVDSGVSFTNDLAGRYLSARSRNFVPPFPGGTPDPALLAPSCAGVDHGTAVATIAAGGTYGIAKNAQVVNIRVLDCAEAYSDSSTVILGLQYMVQDHQAHPGQVSIANLSLSSFGTDLELDRNVMSAVQAGITITVSAGNEGIDACTRSPARTGNPSYIPTSISNPTGASTIVVGGTMTSGAADSYWSSVENGASRISNYGPCVDIFAPSYHVTTLDRFGTPYSNWWGTSFAAPHVAGVAALHVERYGGNTSPGMLEAVIKDNGSKNFIAGLPPNTNNLLLWSFVIRRRP